MKDQADQTNPVTEQFDASEAMPSIDNPDMTVLFASKVNANGVPVLMFLVPEQALAAMASGQARDFDLTDLGFNAIVILGRSPTYADAVQSAAALFARVAGEDAPALKVISHPPTRTMQ